MKREKPSERDPPDHPRFNTNINPNKATQGWDLHTYIIQTKLIPRTSKRWLHFIYHRNHKNPSNAAILPRAEPKHRREAVDEIFSQ
jgi:hypothetical protein